MFNLIFCVVSKRFECEGPRDWEISRVVSFAELLRNFSQLFLSNIVIWTIGTELFLRGYDVVSVV